MGFLGQAANSGTNSLNLLQHAIDVVKSTYGDTVSINAKNKDLRKWGINLNVGTSAASIMTLAGSEVAETFVSTNAITTAISDSGSDTQNIVLHEGHTISAGDLTFFADTTVQALTGTTPITLNTAGARNTRARLSSPAVGNIYFYEGGSVMAGVPDDDAEVHMIIPAGEIQTQKASTAISSVDYWFITGATCSVLEKTASWVQARIEIKPITATYFYPITQWVGVSDNSGTINLLGQNDPFLIIPPNHDVRLVAIADNASTPVAGGMQGPLGLIVS